MPRITWTLADGRDVTTVRHILMGDLPADGTIRAEDWQGYDVEVGVELVDGRYRCRALHVWQRTDGVEVTGEAIRTLSLKRIMRAGTAKVEAFHGLPVKGETPTEDEKRLAWVARTYRRAYAVGDPPKQAVAEGLGVSSATAGRWISRARRAGLLGPAEGPGRAGG